MLSIKFTFNGIETIIQCKKEDKMKDICNRYLSKIEILDINSLIFLYGGEKINLNLTVGELANSTNINRNEMNILVCEIQKSTINDDKNLKNKSKEIICPKCYENCKIQIKDYKIKLFDCKNDHELNNLSFEEFNNSQFINESIITCNNCNNINKNKTYNKQFFKCITCNNNLCPLCKSIYNDTHKVIDYDKKNYICNIHNDSYISYCNKCKINLCMQCEIKHECHEIIYFKKILPNEEEIKKNINEFRKSINELKNNINQIINILNTVIENLEIYFTINYDMIKNYKIENRNYNILYNINEIKNNCISKEIKKIINENSVINRFKNIFDIYNIMNNNKDINNGNINKKGEINKDLNDNNQITIKYKINKDENKIKIFGKNFVENNKEKCKIICNNIFYDLTEYFDISSYDKNNDIFEINLFGINNIINMSFMFHECKELLSLNDIYKIDTKNTFDMKYMFYNCFSLLSIPDISIWDTSKVTDMSFMFEGCNKLTLLPDISKWKTNNIKDMSHMFALCSSLSLLPDISKWNTDKIEDMRMMFYSCSSLKSLPDISKWNTENVNNMNYMFQNCKILLSIPDISKWNINNVINMNDIFLGCRDSLNIPDKFRYKKD